MWIKFRSKGSETLTLRGSNIKHSKEKNNDIIAGKRGHVIGSSL